MTKRAWAVVDRSGKPLLHTIRGTRAGLWKYIQFWCGTVTTWKSLSDDGSYQIKRISITVDQPLPPGQMEDGMPEMVALRTIPTGHDLHHYIFRDQKHAKEWLTQKFVNDEEYGVDIVSVRVTPCCHRETVKKVLRRMTVTEYLKSIDQPLAITAGGIGVRR